MDYIERFRVAPGSKVDLKSIEPGFTNKHGDRAQAEAETQKYCARLRELQDLLHVQQRHSLLVCLQALDTGGKDGTINHVLSAMNPQGCRVQAFKQPTPLEAAHDFLWRVHPAVPGRGEVVLFNRSHYEDVLVVRVHDLVPKAVWSRRYDLINAFEQGLVENGTHLLKFYLHISPEEQLRRFKQRLDDPSKQWKISEADYQERQYWDAYRAAYEEALSRCSTEQAPWFVIPADHKWFRNLAVARIVVELLEGLKMGYPAPTVDLDRIRRDYHAEAAK